MIIGALMLCGAGPISKFEDRSPTADFDSAAKSGDIERCLIDLEGMNIPRVFRQPDRPDRVTIVWQVAGYMSAPLTDRVDLIDAPAGTHVRAWFNRKRLDQCAVAR
ncbi:hypothetical protein [Sphingomonas sp. MMS24-J13]|uniref:hypothetical protein n=1 Tax=Sphingomonas sp. MMS24-J13 TaxID=3238686 RepID=UPI0038502535